MVMDNGLPTTMTELKKIASYLAFSFSLLTFVAYLFLDPTLVGYCHTETLLTGLDSANPVPVCEEGSHPVPARERFIGTALGLTEPGYVCQDKECGNNIELAVVVALVLVLSYLLFAFREVKKHEAAAATMKTKPVGSVMV